MGLDLGQAVDFTAAAVLEHAGPGPAPHLPDQEVHVRHLARYPLGTAYPDVVDDVGRLLGREPLAGQAALALDRTGVGRAVWDLFARAGQGPAATIRAPVYGVTLTAGSEVRHEGDAWWVPKADVIAAAQVALQDRRLRIAPDLKHAPTLVGELSNYRYGISASGRLSFGVGGDDLSWRESDHDDVLLAVCIGLWVMQNVRPPPTVTALPDLPQVSKWGRADDPRPFGLRR